MDVLDGGYTMTERSKTAGTYGFQPCLFSDICQEVMTLYLGSVHFTTHFFKFYNFTALIILFIDNIRPLAERKYVLLLDESSYLFPSFRYPDKPCDIAWQLEAFYRRVGGLSINSTLLRSLVTTEVHDLYLDGKVSERQKEAVDKVSGHTSAIAKRHYTLKDRERGMMQFLYHPTFIY